LPKSVPAPSSQARSIAATGSAPMTGETQAALLERHRRGGLAGAPCFDRVNFPGAEAGGILGLRAGLC
jgi:hypothetical protein